MSKSTSTQAKEDARQQAESANRPAEPAGPAGPQADILALQQAAGNQAVSRLLQTGPTTDSPAGAAGALPDQGQPLEPATRTTMESRFGRNFSGVRVHNNTAAAQLAGQLSARAFTVGQEVTFAAGEYRPGTLQGNQLIAHELAHTVQQEPGQPSRAASTGAEARLEQEADQAAAAAISPAPGPAKQVAPMSRTGLAVQKKDGAKPGMSPELRFAIILSSLTTAEEARDALDVYKKLSAAKRRKLFEANFKGGGIAKLIRTLSAEDAAGPYRDEIRELLRWVEEEETRKASGMTDEEMAEAQAKFSQAKAEKEAQAAIAAKTPKGVTPAKPTQKEVEQAHKEQVSKTSIAPTKTTTWDKLPKATRDSWLKRGKAVIKSVVAHASKKHPELKLTEDLFLADFGGVEKRGQRVLAYGSADASGKTRAVFGFRFVEAAEADPAYVLSVVVHEVFGHPEYGPYGTEYHLALYDKAAAKTPGYTKPPAGSTQRTQEIDAYAYQETEIYALLRSLPYHTPVAPKDAAKNLVSIDPKTTVEYRIGLIKQQWKPELAIALLHGIYQRLLLDPRITGKAFNAFKDGVKANFTDKEAKEILK